MRGRVVLTSRSLSEENLKKKNEIQGVKFRDETFALVFYSVVAALRKWKSGKKKRKTKFEELDIVIKIWLERLIYFPEQTSLSPKKKRRNKIIKTWLLRLSFQIAFKEIITLSCFNNFCWIYTYMEEIWKKVLDRVLIVLKY